MSTVDPADIRGLVTTLLDSVKRLPLSSFEDRPRPPHNAVEGDAKPRPRLCSSPEDGGVQEFNGTSFAIAHMNAISSLAMAVTTTFACLPRARSLR